MVDGVAAETHVSNGLPAHHPRANGVGAVRLNVLHSREMDAVFVAEGQITEEIFERVDTALRKQLGALRPNALDHAHFRAEAHGHDLLFISKGKGVTNLLRGYILFPACLLWCTVVMKIRHPLRCLRGLGWTLHSP